MTKLNKEQMDIINGLSIDELKATIIDCMVKYEEQSTLIAMLSDKRTLSEKRRDALAILEATMTR